MFININEKHPIKNIFNKYSKQQKSSNKNKGFLSKFLAQQSKWKKYVREKHEQLIETKATIKAHEVKLSVLIAVFIVLMAFSLVTLLVLTPLSLMGLAFKVPHLLWSIGIGGVIFGVTVGVIAIKSSLQLHDEREELEMIVKEKKHFKLLLKYRNVIGVFLDFDKLKLWDVIDLPVESYQKILSKEYWKNSAFVELIEDLEHVLHYEKNQLPIPADMQKALKQLFKKLM